MGKDQGAGTPSGTVAEGAGSAGAFRSPVGTRPGSWGRRKKEWEMVREAWHPEHQACSCQPLPSPLSWFAREGCSLWWLSTVCPSLPLACQEHEVFLATLLLPDLRSPCLCLLAGPGDVPPTRPAPAVAPRQPRLHQELSPRNPRAPPRTGQQLICSIEGLPSFLFRAMARAGPTGSLWSS